MSERSVVFVLYTVATSLFQHSIPLHREELGRLKLENVKLQSLLKEQTSSQLKEKESIDASEEGSDVPSESPTSVETPQTKDKVFSNNTMMSKEKNSNIALDCEISEGTHSHRYITKPHALRRGVSSAL